MDSLISLRFESTLHAPAERVWAWITSVEGIRSEMRPFLLMTVPRGVRSLSDVEIKPGARMFRSYFLLFGFIPVDYSDLTLQTLSVGDGFVEQSPMGSMRLWRHERRIVPSASAPGAVVLVDQLSFQPCMASRLVGWFIRRFFIHRHQVIRSNLEGVWKP